MPFTIAYNGNGSDGRSPPVDPHGPYNPGETVPVQPAGSMTKTGAAFAYWNTNPDGSGTFYGWPLVAPLVMPGANLTLYAQWLVTTGRNNGGTTDHYAFSYDSSLQAGGLEPGRTSILFLYYLFSQLGFSIPEIIAAAPGYKDGVLNATAPLRGVYQNLTGDAGDPFPFFKQLLDNAFPPDQVSSIPGTTTGDLDNPFSIGIRPMLKDVFSGGRDTVRSHGQRRPVLVSPRRQRRWRLQMGPQPGTKGGNRVEPQNCLFRR